MSVERGRSYKHAKSAGKGSKQRPTDLRKFGAGWERAFKRKGKFK